MDETYQIENVPLFANLPSAQLDPLRKDAVRQLYKAGEIISHPEYGRGKVEISRFKGLGEMPARFLRATTMDPAQRTLLRVVVPPRADPAAIEPPGEGFARTEKLVETLMGRRPELRFDYIQKNARFARDLDL